MAGRLESRARALPRKERLGNGPRNCIAQGLVMIELRVLLASTVRGFVVQDAYERWKMVIGKGRKCIPN